MCSLFVKICSIRKRQSMMLALAFAWTELSSKSALTARNVSERRPILYAMTQSFIAQLRDAVFKDHPFVAHLYERAHIERIVVAALEAWSLNMLDVEISMTPNATRADIIFQGALRTAGTKASSQTGSIPSSKCRKIDAGMSSARGAR